MRRIINITKKILRDEEGAALVEYGLLVGLISVICITAITNTGTAIQKIFTAVAAALTAAAS